MDAEEVTDDLDQSPRCGDDSQTDESGGNTVSGTFGLTLVATGGEPFEATPDEVDKDENTGNDNDDGDTGRNQTTEVSNFRLSWLSNTDVLSKGGSSKT